MNLWIRSLACFALVTLSAGRALSAETFLLVRLSDMTRTDALQVMTPEEFKTLQKQLQQEDRFFPKAVLQAVDEWRKDEMNKSTPFPAGKVVPRKIVGQPEKFATREKAEERIAQYEDRESRKRLRDSEKGGKKALSEAEKAKYDKEIDKELLVRRAADAVAAKLSALTGVEIAPADPFAGQKEEEKAPEDKPADAKAEKKEAGGAVKKAL